jgi:hypothetical protein
MGLVYDSQLGKHFPIWWLLAVLDVNLQGTTLRIQGDPRSRGSLTSGGCLPRPCIFHARGMATFCTFADECEQRPPSPLVVGQAAGEVVDLTLED